MYYFFLLFSALGSWDGGLVDSNCVIKPGGRRCFLFFITPSITCIFHSFFKIFPWVGDFGWGLGFAVTWLAHALTAICRVLTAVGGPHGPLSHLCPGVCGLTITFNTAQAKFLFREKWSDAISKNFKQLPIHEGLFNLNTIQILWENLQKFKSHACHMRYS